MPFLEWDDSMSVGVEAFDAQHKELIATIDEFAQAFFDGQGSQVLSRIFGHLIAFMKTHFQEEENLMVQYGYEDYGTHREEHKELVRKLNELQVRHQERDRNVPSETFHFLKVWFMHHVLETDMKYRDFFREQGAE